jgi:hypothetical protein
VFVCRMVFIYRRFISCIGYVTPNVRFILNDAIDVAERSVAYFRTLPQ